MAKKHLSFIIIPHNKEKFRTVSLSKRSLRIFVGVCSVLIVALTVFLIDYFTMNVTRQKYKNLLDENADQKQALAQYEESIENLQKTVDSFESYAKKLNVMAGLKSEDVLNEEPGVGGASVTPESLTVDAEPDNNLTLLENIGSKAQGIEKNLITLNHFFEEEILRLASTPTIWPTKGYMSSAFGWRDDPFTGKRTFHYGIDIATHYGNPVIATADGVVIQTKIEKISGRTIKINHRGGITTVYCHLSKFLVKSGQRVKRGDVIGLVGKTGKARGPHVHYEVRKNGKALNPYYYILED
jgi:murein DD-endopeptidase MepM/ murein hydrolase activator NlpD